MTHVQANLLEYLRSKTQVDLDTFDITALGKFGQCVDCTSNQYEYYTELAKPTRQDILQKTIQTTEKLHGDFPETTFEELAVEVAAVLLGIEMLPAFTGNLHLMSNPKYAYSKQKVVETGKRYHKLFNLLHPSFPTSRLVMKIPATWEALQAGRELRASNIKTLGTTLFTMEQAVLAGEVGCVSISPFVHELKRMFEPGHQDEDLLGLCLHAQQWYEQKNLRTKVKACATVGVEELLQLAGVDALTIVPDDLSTLQSTQRDSDELTKISMFKALNATNEEKVYGPYVDDEAKYRLDFAHADGGQAQFKLAQAIIIFSDFQAKAEAVIRDARA
ncbi:aldolase [Aspergillus karnatakaensis]|uniref:aldolase n=1 Tax=Aspergillus karnatakaensis TaxID=1810916 RepID=UPI003CCD8AF3